MPQVLVLQHHVVHGYAGNPISTDLKGYDGLVVMGGPAGVYEQTQFPHLQDELQFIDCAAKAQLPIFGVGSQLRTAALAAQVHRGEADCRRCTESDDQPSETGSAWSYPLPRSALSEPV